jgi:hypothetical protein
MLFFCLVVKKNSQILFSQEGYLPIFFLKFSGISLEGAAIKPRKDVNAKFYGSEVRLLFEGGVLGVG